MTTDLDAHRCVFCGEIVASGDPIACPTHRARMDEIVMPWEQQPRRPARAAAGQEE